MRKQCNSRFSRMSSDTVVAMTLADLKEFARDIMNAATASGDELMSEREVMERYPIKRTLLYKLRKNGQLVCLRCGGRVYYRQSDVNRVFTEGF